MAKEVSSMNLCPERNRFASEEERMCDNDIFLRCLAYERTPLLDPSLRWICPIQENCATKMNVVCIGECISKRFWLAGIDETGYVLSVRSIGVKSLLQKAVGVVMEYGEEAPNIPAVLNEHEEWTLPTNLSYIHAVKDTSWIHDDGYIFSVKRPVALKPTGSREVYLPKSLDGKYMGSDGHIELEATNMKFFSLDKAPSEAEAKEAVSAIWDTIGDNFYNEVSIIREYGVRYSHDHRRIMKCPADYSGVFKIPDDIMEIGDYAFSNCSGLTAIEIPNSIKRIGAKAFYNCKGLTTIDIPNNVTYISADAFDECNPHVAEIADIYRTKLEEKIRQQREEEETARRLEAERARQEAERARQEAERAREEAKRIAAEQERLRIIKAREAEEQRRMQEQQLQEMLQGSILFFDTETTGKPLNYKAPVTDSYNWPRLVQLAWIMTDKEGNILKKKSVIIKPKGFSIPTDAVAVHGITTERAERDGLPLSEVLEEFATDLSFAERIVGHNIDFDQHIVGAELWRMGMDYNVLMNKPSTCTMKSSTDFCAIPNPNTYYGGYKWPSLQELYQKLFDRTFDDAHDALADISATIECFFELKRRGII